MRQYRQFCGVAKALDRVGDRWTLLIVRDLLPGGRRYTDLLEGLPGITTNLLARRLKELVERGLLEKHVAPPPSGSTVYRLTEAGRELEPVVLALGRFGARYMTAPEEGDVLSPRWAVVSLMRRYQGIARPATLSMAVGERVYGLELGENELRVQDGEIRRPDLRLGCDQEVFFALISRRETARELVADGRLSLVGSRRDLARIARALDLRP